MSAEGIISSSCLFHDKDGDAALRVVSLSSSESYASGNVAVVSGTCGTTAVTIDFSQYKTAAGDAAAAGDWPAVIRLAFSASPAGIMETSGNIAAMSVGSKAGEVACVSNPGFAGSTPDLDPVVTVKAVSGTASYTVVIVGTS